MPPTPRPTTAPPEAPVVAVDVQAGAAAASAGTLPPCLRPSAHPAPDEGRAEASAVPVDVRMEARTKAAVTPGYADADGSPASIDVDLATEAAVIATPGHVPTGAAAVPAGVGTVATVVRGVRAGGAAADDARTEAVDGAGVLGDVGTGVGGGPVEVRAVGAYLPSSTGAGGVADSRALRVAARRRGGPVVEGEWVPAPAGAMVDVPPRSGRRGDRGQATTEYGLVLMVAGSLAIAVLMWARDSDALTGLFDLVIDKLTGGI